MMAKRDGHCFWHEKDDPDAVIREPMGVPLCWEGWIGLLHATGTCAGQCNFDTDPGPEAALTARCKMEGRHGGTHAVQQR